MQICTIQRTGSGGFIKNKIMICALGEKFVLPVVGLFFVLGCKCGIGFVSCCVKVLLWMIFLTGY